MSIYIHIATPRKRDKMRGLPSILSRAFYLFFTKIPTSVLKALPGKIDIKRHSPSIYSLYLGQPRDVNKRSQSLAL